MYYGKCASFNFFSIFLFEMNGQRISQIKPFFCNLESRSEYAGNRKRGLESVESPSPEFALKCLRHSGSKDDLNLVQDDLVWPRMDQGHGLAQIGGPVGVKRQSFAMVFLSTAKSCMESLVNIYGSFFTVGHIRGDELSLVRVNAHFGSLATLFTV